MKTITKEYTIYSIEELKEKAFDKAYANWTTSVEYPWYSENIQTIKKFCELFSLRLEYYSYNCQSFQFSFSSQHETEIDKLSGSRLCAYLYNNYSGYLFNQKQYHSKDNVRYSRIFLEKNYELTGWYLDYTILDIILKFLECPEKDITFLKLMDKCLNAAFDSCMEDIKYYFSEERFKEICEEEDYMFLEDGTKFED